MARRFDPALIPASPNLDFEQAWWQEGLTRVAGLDEAGRGALAGPLYAAAVILPADSPNLAIELAGVRDSKQLTPTERERLTTLIRQTALDSALGIVETEEIDSLGMAAAGRLCFQRAIASLAQPPAALLLDYFPLPSSPVPQKALIKGDQRSLSIACASILAKTARDAHMRELDASYPGYGLAANKGYASAGHCQALRQLGPCPQHRRSFHLKQEQLILFPKEPEDSLQNT